MSKDSAPDGRYTMGYDEDFRQLLNRRSARTHAAYLLPHLRAGQTVLDFGCGPGTISLGLAQAVDPGKLHGVDMEETQIALARSAAESGGHENVAFHVGNINDLPFEDATFDVAHCHAVLMHIPDIATALAEVHRVLKPGGTIACREAIVASSFLEPGSAEIDRAWGVFTKLLAANGGHPQLGRELKQQLLDAGFEEIRPAFSFDSFGTDADVEFFHGFIVDWFHSPAVVEAAIKYSLSTAEEFERGRDALEAWRTSPGAVGSIGFGECLATKPRVP